MVYILNKNNQPLMPCPNVIARLLLKQGKAKVKRRTPFTIKLLYDTTNYIQELTHGVDTGSSKIGSAVVNNKNEIIYLSEITVRNDISDKMVRRAIYRRNRRKRNARYRKPRFLNRKNSIKKDRFSPTILSKINSHLKEIKFVKSILPITKLIIETASFDEHALKNPEVLKSKWLYKKGANYRFANTKAFVLNRDNHQCQNCKGKYKDKHLNVHHIVFRSSGGSDDAENLITLCKTCHDKLHHGEINLSKIGKKKSISKHATHMNSIRIQLLKKLSEAEETFGFITKENRQLLKLEKSHIIDAAVISGGGNLMTFKVESVLYKRCVADGDFRRTQGIRSQIKIPNGKIMGFLKFDKVKYLGKEYFIKGRNSRGYAVLMDINKTIIKLKPLAKFDKMQRVSARKVWLLNEKFDFSCL